MRLAAMAAQRHPAAKAERDGVTGLFAFHIVTALLSLCGDGGGRFWEGIAGKEKLRSVWPWGSLGYQDTLLQAQGRSQCGSLARPSPWAWGENACLARAL